ncbi:chromatin modification-related protein [Podospora fimiseda]|uniref:Chromatin modification-related protein EAF6 n=1 Tax=Podospora fimiseda TaxID=252190 RepID=A0AAN7H1Y6_9PEZI|nr:chromatin modification-related protein [Podospora fimiseda]
MTDSNSAANKSAGAATDGKETQGLPYYEKKRQELKALLAKRRAIDRQLQQEEERIYAKETEYLESTPSGNIITGFDSYTKGTPANSAAVAAARRKGGGGGAGLNGLDQMIEKNRVFSRSSISYNGKGAGDGSDGVQTPGGASTPAEDVQTPGSGKNVGTGIKKVVLKKRDAGGDGDDDAGSNRDAKKVRVSFGASGQVNGGVRK